MNLLKILLVFGTRPEAIKMAPVYHALKARNKFCSVEVCVTGQHREMLDMVVDFFNININYDLNVMKANQSLSSVSSEILKSFENVLNQSKPDWVVVHGDTITSMIAALGAFFSKIKVAHVEAGLRTYNKFSPFPEEINRTITARLADAHFAPTIKSKDNLIKEGVPQDSILITGNTVIDALFLGLNKVNESSNAIKKLSGLLINGKKIILVTAHRRENFGEGFINLCEALKSIAEKYSNQVQIVYPVHLNPNVREPVNRFLKNLNNVLLVEPLDYEAFIWLMNKSYLIITDSGGVQEEAPSLGKPVLVMRNTTERPEAVEAGTVILVGTDKVKILQEASKLIDSVDAYNLMSSVHNPYGDGKASDRISDYFINN